MIILLEPQFKGFISKLGQWLILDSPDSDRHYVCQVDLSFSAVPLTVDNVNYILSLSKAQVSLQSSAEEVKSLQPELSGPAQHCPAEDTDPTGLSIQFHPTCLHLRSWPHKALVSSHLLRRSAHIFLSFLLANWLTVILQLSPHELPCLCPMRLFSAKALISKASCSVTAKDSSTRLIFSENDLSEA